MGEDSEKYGGAVELNYDVEYGGQEARYQNASSDSIRITALDSSSRLGQTLPALSEASTEGATNPDIKQRVGFGETVPAPVEAVSGADMVGALLAKVRKRAKSTPGTGTMIAERYRVIRVLGEGGMGIVLEVSHARLGKSFALKLMRPNISDDRVTRSRFFREAKFASSLTHKNLISVLDYDEDPNFGAYMVMELAGGVLLSRFLSKRGKLQIKRACDIILQIAQALAYIHEQNLIHCDLKAQNVMLVTSEEDGRKTHTVKLLDFGLAQSRSAPSMDTVFGTPRYISPEVALREPATALSDVYSLGVLFFELLTGQGPFQGDTQRLLRAHIGTKPPTVADIRGGEVDPALEQLIATALAKSPDERQRSMSAFIYELKNFIQMSNMASGRSSQLATSAVAPAPSERSQLVSASYDALRLPLATIAADGSIVCANAAFSKFILGMRVGIEGSNLHESALAPAWTNITSDIEAACRGVSVGRRVEIDLSSGEIVTLQMWLEPTNRSGFAVLSLYPEH